MSATVTSTAAVTEPGEEEEEEVDGEEHRLCEHLQDGKDVLLRRQRLQISVHQCETAVDEDVLGVWCGVVLCGCV